jgi:hypothetical protein
VPCGIPRGELASHGGRQSNANNFSLVKVHWIKAVEIILLPKHIRPIRKTWEPLQGEHG